MRKIEQLFSEYGESHQNGTNKIIHWICVPLIFWTILGFISYIPTPHFYIPSFGYISIASIIALMIVSIFYFRLSVVVGIIMIFLMLIMEYFIFVVQSSIRYKILDSLFSSFYHYMDSAIRWSQNRREEAKFS